MLQEEAQADPAPRWSVPRAYLDALLGRLFRRFPRFPEAAAGDRVYAIGDVHGRLDLLRRLLRSLDADASGRSQHEVRIVLLGDMVDRGPHSRQVLELVRFLQRRDPERFVALLGNHEELLLASACGHADAQRVWLRTGGDATLRSYRLDPIEFARLSAAKRGPALRQALGPDMIAWLESLPLTWRSGDYFFCHAGVRPGVPLRKQRREDLLWIRDEFLGSERAHGAVIVHGHSEASGAEVTANRINVDTAAHRSGELTAVALQGSYRWFLSTARMILHRSALEEARQWLRPNPKRSPGWSRSVPLPDAEAA